MNSELLRWVIISIVLLSFCFDTILNYLNHKSWTVKCPDNLKDYYDEEKYQKSYSYNKENYFFSLYSSLFSTIVLLVVLYSKGFGWFDMLIRSHFANPIIVSLVFFAVLALASDIIGTPFSLYHTFVIEEKYGFNKTTIKTFIIDKIKGYILGSIVGGLLLWILITFFENMETSGWLWAWGVITIFMVLINMFYTNLILPLFNKLTPLESGILRSEIEEYCKKADFKLTNIFVMDGSKRSSKANAFFSGMGKSKKIVLFDTLITNHSNDELISILAHEVGHYKKKHTMQHLAISVLNTGVLLYLFSLIYNNISISLALGTETPGFHISMLAFGILYTPISELLGMVMNMVSRKNEYEADNFAAQTSNAKDLMSALKKLSIDHLSNLSPHPAYVFVHYSHPTTIQRINKLKEN